MRIHYILAKEGDDIERQNKNTPEYAHAPTQRKREPNKEKEGLKTANRVYTKLKPGVFTEGSSFCAESSFSFLCFSSLGVL